MKLPVSGSLRRWLLFAAAAGVILFYAPTPYLALRPGIAFEADELVSAAEPDKPGSGAFLMMTVRMDKASFWTAVRAAWDREIRIYDKKTLLQGRSMREYERSQSIAMRDSQISAIESAYRAAGIRYTVIKGPVVITDSGASKSGLQTGDMLMKVAGAESPAMDELAALLSRATSAAGSVDAVVRRGDGDIAVKLAVRRQIADGGNDGDQDSRHISEASPDSAGRVSMSPEELVKHALGVNGAAETRIVKPDDSRYNVTIAAQGVGGPSAGLIFALQAYDELTAGDLTRGRRVAGTGTIDADGTVGAVGGVADKVAAAAAAGAGLFLVPRQNAAEARSEASRLGGGMKIVEAGTLEEAISALRPEQPR